MCSSEAAWSEAFILNGLSNSYTVDFKRFTKWPGYWNQPESAIPTHLFIASIYSSTKNEEGQRSRGFVETPLALYISLSYFLPISSLLLLLRVSTTTVYVTHRLQ